MSRGVQAGFTLVELLVAIVVLGILMALLFGGLRFGTRAWEHSDASVSDTDDVRIVQTLFRQEVERACPRRLWQVSPPPVDFDGRAQTVTLLALAPLALDIPGCARVSFFAKPVGDSADLLFHIQPAVDSGPPRERTILHGIAGIEFAYLDGDGGTGAWLPNWTNRRNLPSLVRVRVTFHTGDARIWPELFVSPRISGEADCTYDRATHSCGTN
jgi:general secretion pathway protein J